MNTDSKTAPLVIKGIHPSVTAIFARMTERVTDAIIITDKNFRILLASQLFMNEFGDGNKLRHTNYFSAIFGLMAHASRDLEAKKKIPLYRAVMTGKVAKGPPPTIAAPNDVAYQVETTVASFSHKDELVRVVVEYWRHHGNPKDFERDARFIDFRVD